MAIFLLLYVVFVLAWMAWVGVLSWHVAKYKFPNDHEMHAALMIFGAISLVIIIISIISISRADWVSVPTALKGL